MKAAPDTGPPLKPWRGARATASFERASTSRVDQGFVIRIKKVKLSKKDVKNEGCSQDVIENKGRETTKYGMANIFMKINDLSIMPIYC